MTASVQAVIEHRRTVPAEEAAMAHLALPPVHSRPPVPRFAVVDVLSGAPGPRSLVLDRARKQVEMAHFSHHPEATQVVLALFRAWTSIQHGRFLDTDTSKMLLPMSMYEYQEHQEVHFGTLSKKVSLVLLPGAVCNLLHRSRTSGVLSLST